MQLAQPAFPNPNQFSLASSLVPSSRQLHPHVLLHLQFPLVPGCDMLPRPHRLQEHGGRLRDSDAREPDYGCELQRQQGQRRGLRFEAEEESHDDRLHLHHPAQGQRGMSMYSHGGKFKYRMQSCMLSSGLWDKVVLTRPLIRTFYPWTI